MRDPSVQLRRDTSAALPFDDLQAFRRTMKSSDGQAIRLSKRVATASLDYGMNVRDKYL